MLGWAKPILTWLLIGLKKFRLLLFSLMTDQSQQGKDTSWCKSDVSLGVLGCFRHLERGHLTSWSQVLQQCRVIFVRIYMLICHLYIPFDEVSVCLSSIKKKLVCFYYS